MNQYRKQKTRKLFYGKYPFKVTTTIKNGSYFRIWRVDQIIAWCENNWHPDISRYTNRISNTAEQQRLKEYCTALSLLDKDSYKLRIERSTVSYFLKDRSSYEKCIELLADFINEITEPEDDQVLDAIVEDKKTVICKELPYGKYTHKVILKAQMPVNVKNNLLEWGKKYGEDMICFSPTTEGYLAGRRHYMQDPFLYVADGKMLMMLGLAAQGYIRRTEQFIPRSSINTSS
jgi:hypothetical protein